MIEIKNLSKSFTVNGENFEALKDISLTINDGEIYGIIGMSGAGKSTLVRCINMLEKPTSGEIIIDGKNMCTLSDKELRKERRNITMIFQGFNLLMQRNCLDNICFPLELAGVPRAEAVRKATELISIVGLPDKAKAYPAQLSGGQQQRIAIARALATNPKVLLCDEATSALDPKTTHAILELIHDINKRLNITVVIITHQMSVVEEICDKVAILDEGNVVEEGDVSQVFANPKSPAAKRLVFPDASTNVLAENIGMRTVRVVFNGASVAEKPIITQMAIDEHIAASIINASTKLIGEKVYGSMLLGFEDDDETVKRAINYLSVENVCAEEVGKNV